MNSVVMAALGALVGVGLLAVVASLAGRQLFPGLSMRVERVIGRTERFTLWLVVALFAGALTWALTGWPVGGAWALAGVLALALTAPSGTTASDEINKVEAIASWAEQIRDVMGASAGLQQALVATAQRGPAPIADELAAFARRAPRGDLAGSLHQLGDDLAHPSADLVVAGLVAATELDAGRLVPLLTRLAASIRDEARMRVRVEVGRARVRTSMSIVGIFVVLTVLMLIFVGNGLLAGYDSTAGQLWLIVVGAVVVAAVSMSRRLSVVAQPNRFVSRRRVA